MARTKTKDAARGKTHPSARDNVRLVDDAPLERLDPYAPLTNDEWVHDPRGGSPAAHRRQVRRRQRALKRYVFEPRDLQNITSLGQIAFEKSGRDYDVLFDTMHTELLRRYPGKIAKELSFNINMAGGARGRYALMFGSLYEYILLFNTPIQTTGFSGRYVSDLWDFVATGSLTSFDENRHEPVRKPAGAYTYLPRGTATVYQGEAGTVALEYGRGFIPQALDFGVLRTFLFETGDFVTAGRQLRRYGELLFGIGR